MIVAGETIPADANVVQSDIDGKAYQVGRSGVYIGDSAETLREGFRIRIDGDGMIYEDDA